MKALYWIIGLVVLGVVVYAAYNLVKDKDKETMASTAASKAAEDASRAMADKASMTPAPAPVVYVVPSYRNWGWNGGWNNRTM